MDNTAHTRSNAFNPADYELEAVFDGHEDIDGWVFLAKQNMADTQTRTRNGTVAATVEFDEETDTVERTCVHCGRRYGFTMEYYVRHLPTNALVFMGSGCIDDALLTDEAAYAMKRAANASRNAAHRAEVAAKRAEWDAANPEQAAALDAYLADIDADGPEDAFLTDLCRARQNYGALTEGQTPWPVKALASRAEWAAKRAEREAILATVPDLTEGRYEVVGTVVSVKFIDNDFGGTTKMLVELANGTRVFGTVPNVLFDNEALVDATVAFTAKVERSADDTHFGFFSRPTKARRV